MSRGLIVDEPRLHEVGTRWAQDWWTGFRAIGLAGRSRDLGGRRWQVTCSDTADTHEVLRVMMANGMPRSAVRIVR